MAHSVVELNCPGCGARVSTEYKRCKYCRNPIIIQTFNSVHDMPLPEVNKYANAYRKALSDNPDNTELNKSIAMCYLKLKLYDKALPAFEKALEDNFDDSEIYFYAAICLLRGKKAFVAQRTDINRAIEFLDAANMIEPKGIYYYFLSYIKYDFFERKYLNTSPNYQECLSIANSYGVSEYDIGNLFLILGVQRPTF